MRMYTTIQAVLAVLLSLLLTLCLSVPANASDWVLGDLFAGVSSGTYKVFDNAGVFKESISDGLGGFTTGCSFNPGLTRLYTTNFFNTKVIVYDNPHPHAIVQTVDTNATSPGGNSESIVFAANGDYYVGHPDGNRLIHKYNAAGTLLATFSAAADTRGTDWIDLTADQTTLFYTSEGRAVQRFNVATNTQLANFAALPGSGNAFALRLLPPGDGTGGLLVADGLNVKRLDAGGAVIQTYDVTGEDSWFSLSLDPNGTSFWSGNINSANIYKFNIATGAVEASFNTGTGSGTLFGICLKGELTAAGLLGGRMTGGGNVSLGRGQPVTFGLELHCKKSDLPNNLEVNWSGNRFHLESLDSSLCTDNPEISPNPPLAKFDTLAGTGTGRYNGVSGATAAWTIADAGEPGANDTIKITIRDAGGTVVLSLPTTKLSGGNFQAHPE